MYKVDKSKYFWCYDLALKKRLKQNEIEFITTGTSNKGQRFWLYEKSNELHTVLNRA
ncbi:hypothetical protein [Metabacillus litoralis]|uniref:hypothetical protein n=1 Tax=Metabacillus litoralis TaxID=152268 RepID=UPI000ADACF9A|nr:hypothetical protein [Metabacillus litoralis]